MYALLVPHHDDELIFCHDAVANAALIGFVVDAGWTRTMETLIGLPKLFPNLSRDRLILYRVQEPVCQTPQGSLVPLAKWGDFAPPLPEADVERVCGAFLTRCRRDGVRTIYVPALVFGYAHPHHVQLSRWFHNSSMVEDYGLVNEAVRDPRAKSDALFDCYRSESEGFLRDSASPIRKILESGRDYFDVFRISQP